MNGNIDLTLSLPAYNECASISSTIDEGFGYFQSRGIHEEIILAVNGNDGAREAVGAKSAGNRGLSVIGHEQRSGKWRAVREALAWARGRVIGYPNADNKIPFDEYDKIRPLWVDGHEVVTGSRGLAEFQIERRQTWYCRLGSMGFRWFLQIVSGLPGVHDTQCGFKFFQRGIALDLFRSQKIAHPLA